MRYKRLFLPKEITEEKNIKPIDINNLGNIVAFVGKNGCGKTRILDLIEKNIFSPTTYTSIYDGHFEEVSKDLQELRYDSTFDKEGLQIHELIAQKSKNKQVTGNEIAELQQKLNTQILRNNKKNPNFTLNSQNALTIFSKLDRQLAEIKKRHFRRIKNDDISKLIHTSTEKLKDLFEFGIENKSFDKVDEIISIKESGLSYFLDKLLPQIILEFNQNLKNDELRRTTVFQNKFNSIKDKVNNFLGKKLEWFEESYTQKYITGSIVQQEIRGAWKLDGITFNYDNLSDGEKPLFAYALLFFLIELNDGINLKESIILIDEPELHLHPEMEIKLIDGLRKTVGEKGQIIIATHSLSILSSLNYNEIFMVKDGTISSPKRNVPDDSLNELLSNSVQRFSDFMVSRSNWAFVHFMSECFDNPEVIESSKKNDPQIEAFKSAIKSKSNKTNKLLLDFGAGKGRVLEQLRLEEDFFSKITYDALEIETKFHGVLKELGANETIESYTKLKEKHYDFILLCNVLHEIELNDWIINLNALRKSLNEDGFVVIIEAKQLSKGEKIGEIGYLLLREKEIQVLFNLKEIHKVDKEINSEKITCVVIQRQFIPEITKESLIRTFESLAKNTFEELKILRNLKKGEEKDLIFGRQAAFLSQLNMNAQMALYYLRNLKY